MGEEKAWHECNAYKQTHTHTHAGPHRGRGGFFIKVASISPMSYCKGRALGQRGCSHGSRALLRELQRQGDGVPSRCCTVGGTRKRETPGRGEWRGKAVSRIPEGQEKTNTGRNGRRDTAKHREHTILAEIQGQRERHDLERATETRHKQGLCAH